MNFEIKVMNSKLLETANETAIKEGYNRTLNTKKFFETVSQYGYNPDTAKYPVFPLMPHEHADGKITDLHMRIEIIGPYNEDGMVMKAVLDCPMEIYQQLPVYDYEASEVKSIN